jgi:hypothetical protein
MLKFKTYAENVRVAAQTANNAQGRPLKIRELSIMTGFSYEHIRKIWHGKRDKSDVFSVSRECNDNVCQVLGLDKEEMWRLAEREKFSQRIGYVPMRLQSAAGNEISEIWKHMNEEEQMALLESARTIVGLAQHVTR